MVNKPIYPGPFYYQTEAVTQDGQGQDKTCQDTEPHLIPTPTQLGFYLCGDIIRIIQLSFWFMAGCWNTVCTGW